MEQPEEDEEELNHGKLRATAVRYYIPPSLKEQVHTTASQQMHGGVVIALHALDIDRFGELLESHLFYWMELQLAMNDFENEQIIIATCCFIQQTAA